MKNSDQHTARKRTALSTFLLIVALAVLSVFASEAIAENSKGGVNAQSESVRELLEDLYLEYEAVDKRLIELKEGLTELPAGEKSLLTPFTIAVKKKKNDFILNFIEIKDNGSPLWSHIYTPVENSAMEDGGRHQFFKGSVPKGKHRLTIKYQYSYSSGDTPYKEDMGCDTSLIEEVLGQIRGEKVIIIKSTGTATIKSTKGIGLAPAKPPLIAAYL